MLRATLALALLALAGCAGAPEKEPPAASRSGLYPNETPELRALIERYSAAYGVPVYPKPFLPSYMVAEIHRMLGVAGLPQAEGVP